MIGRLIESIRKRLKEKRVSSIILRGLKIATLKYLNLTLQGDIFESPNNL